MLINQMPSTVFTLLYYVSASLCCVLGFFPDRKGLRLPLLAEALMLMIAVTGVINIVLTGNSTVQKQLFTIMSVGIALLLLDRRVGRHIFTLAFLVNALVVLAGIALNGSRGPIYYDSSVNFVSVHLLCPMLLYYCSGEESGENAPLWPALLTFAMCLAVQGRAGILFTAFFLFGVLFFRLFPRFLRLERRKKYLIVLAGVALCVLAVVLVIAFDVVDRVELFARFAEHGFSSNGRFKIWSDYFLFSTESLQDFLVAPDMSIIEHKPHLGKLGWGNLHNSFLNIHAYNGIVTFVTVLVLCVRSVWYGLRQRKWMYLLCFATFSLRSFTDFVFWGSPGTPFFFYFLFFPLVDSWKCHRLSLPLKTPFRRGKKAS